MAISCAVTASTTTPKAGQRVPCVITITNDQTVSYRVTSVTTWVTGLNVPARVTQPHLSAGAGAGLDSSKATQVVVVNETAAGGTLVFPFEFVGFAPQMPAASAIAYVVNALCTFSDGTTATNTVTINVSPVSSTNP